MTKGDRKMDLFNIICGVCSIAGLLVSVFTAGNVVKIAQTVNSGNVDDHSKVVNKGSRNTYNCLLYTSPSPRDGLLSRMPSSA